MGLAEMKILEEGIFFRRVPQEVQVFKEKQRYE